MLKFIRNRPSLCLLKSSRRPKGEKRLLLLKKWKKRRSLFRPNRLEASGGVPAQFSDMEAARAQINDFSANMSGQLLSDNVVESSTKVVALLSSLMANAAALTSQAKEGLDAGLITACQLKDARAKIVSLEEELDGVNHEFHTSKSIESVLQSQLGSAREASRAAQACEVAAKNAEKVARKELQCNNLDYKTKEKLI
ncbi:uncharacterized protein LOC141594411 [Silene latifolia]|uniref:uncharacterized protein LOC141594411 n=1 Tax=Silene latifolia TaxID=37657 RepID=UPI003D76A964